MPVPIPAPPSSPADGEAQPYYVRDTQNWAVEQERQRHNQALYQIGEYAMFALMWHIRDHALGLVERCSTCTGTPGSRAALIQDVYKQPTQNRCPDCYGTTFDGGYKALIVRPAIFTDADDGEQKQSRGVVTPDEIDVESTTDFRVRAGDYCFRQNGHRYRLLRPSRVQLRTGFGPVSQANAAIGYNHARAVYEDPNASVAYDIPPPYPVLPEILNRGSRLPADFSPFEVIRGPLIPTGE